MSDKLARPTAVVVPVEAIKERIHMMRGEKVMLDEDLAQLYGVETKVFVQAVKRNLTRFPPDFMFRLQKTEFETLRSQNVTSNITRGGRRYAPYAFTEQGVAMLSSVLRSPTGDCCEHRDHARLCGGARGVVSELSETLEAARADGRAGFARAS